MKKFRAGIVVAAAVTTLLGACSYSDTKVPEYKEPEAAKPSPASCTTTDADLRSYDPSRDEGSAVRRIREAGVLKVGVSGDTLLLGSRNPTTNKIVGFDIDIAQRMADELGVDLQTRVITADDRIKLLQDHEIDLVVRNMTINCDRWSKIAFSAEYYRAGQKVLVRSNKTYEGPEDLKGLRVCAPKGTTSLLNVQEQADKAGVEITLNPAANHTGCLVKFQQGQVDAITGDDTVLAGLVAQDKLYAKVPEQKAFSREPYGIGVNQDDRDLAAFVNAVLQEMRGDGSWQKSYDTWLRPSLAGVDPAPFQPAYDR